MLYFLSEVHCLAELGTRQSCRDKVAMFTGQKIVDYCIMYTFVVATKFRHRGLHIFHGFTCHRISITMSRCRCREAQKLSRAQPS